MKANGGLTRENSERFRKYILSVGNSGETKHSKNSLVTIWKSNLFKKTLDFREPTEIKIAKWHFVTVPFFLLIFDISSCTLYLSCRTPAQ
jgi:hypothetical protein